MSDLIAGGMVGGDIPCHCGRCGASVYSRIRMSIGRIAGRKGVTSAYFIEPDGSPHRCPKTYGPLAGPSPSASATPAGRPGAQRRPPSQGPQSLQEAAEALRVRRAGGKWW